MTDSFKSYSFLKQILENSGLNFKIISGYDKDKYSKYGILVISLEVSRDKFKGYLSRVVSRSSECII